MASTFSKQQGSIYTNQDNSSSLQISRSFIWLLLGICLLALIPRLIISATDIIQYDGYWHIFIATQNRWRLFVSEWKGDAHPPLYYLLLRGLAKLGHHPLIYRSLSILPGLASIYLLGTIAAKFFRNRAMALLTAGAYGFSLTIIELDCDVRAYPLGLFFVLCSFYWLLEASNGSQEKSGIATLLFGVSCTLAILTEYMTIFYYLMVLLVTLLLGMRFSQLRNRLTYLLQSRPAFLAVPLTLPVIAMLWLYRVHVRFQPTTQGNVDEFYWQTGTSKLQFILKNVRNELNFLSPFEINNATFCLFLVTAVIALVLGFSILRKTKNGRHLAPAILGSTLLGVLMELMLLGVARRYPFGGFARQQSILFPFMVLTGFWLLDFLIARFPRTLQTGFHVLIVLLVAASFAYGWNKQPRYKEDLFTREYNVFEQNLPHSQAVYIDQFSLIGYFIHTRDWQWKFKGHHQEPERIDEYQTLSPTGEQRMVTRNLEQWNFDLLRPETYATLARLERDAHLSSADIFYFRQFSHPMDNAALAVDAQRFRDLAKGAGLTIGKLYYDGQLAYIHTSLQ